MHVKELGISPIDLHSKLVATSENIGCVLRFHVSHEGKILKGLVVILKKRRKINLQRERGRSYTYPRLFTEENLAKVEGGGWLGMNNEFRIVNFQVQLWKLLDIQLGSGFHLKTKRIKFLLAD